MYLSGIDTESQSRSKDFIGLGSHNDTNNPIAMRENSKKKIYYLFQASKWIPKAQYIYFVQPWFTCPNKDQKSKKKEEEEKMCKITNFKAKKGQNKYNMIG